MITKYFTIMCITYHVAGAPIESRIVFPSYKECGDALASVYDPVRKFDPEAFASCEMTNIMSKTMRPVLRPW